MMPSSPTTGSIDRHALSFIFVAVFIDAVGIGITLPVAPKLISALAHTNLSVAARFGGMLMFVYAGMQFLFAPLMGNLSDRFGRRPLMISAMAGLGINYLLVAMAPSLFWLFLGRFLSGIAGASYSTANAYVADITPAHKRSARFGILGAAFGAGFVVGPALGGLLGDISLRLPFFASAGLAGINAIYGLLVLKESLPADRRRAFEWRRANPLGALMALKRVPGLVGLGAVLVLVRFAHDANASVWAFFTMERFHWSMREVGLSLMAFGGMTAIAYGGLTRLLIPRLGEPRAIYLGLGAGALAFAGVAFSQTGWQIYALMPIFAVMALVLPALNAMMSKTVGATEQGELQGALTSLGSLTSVAAPPSMTSLFSWYTSPTAPIYFPGAAFLAASMCLLVAAAVFFGVERKIRAQDKAVRPAAEPLSDRLNPL